MKTKLYIVKEECVQNYEVRWKDYHIYYHESNALKKLQDIKEQDMLPIVDEENYVVQCDRPRHYEAGRDNFFDKSRVCVRIIETPLEDFEIGG